MKIIFMGSAAFAVPSLEALLQRGYDVLFVVTQPDKPAGRGLKLLACPVATFAGAKNLPLFQPRTLRDDASLKKIADAKADLVVIVAYGKILPNSILEMPALGCINVHASLLPKYRGAAPINWAIANGEQKTGITTMMVNERMDAGGILLQAETSIGTDETAPLLHDRLAQMGAELLIKTIDAMEKKRISPRSQDESQATYAPILKKEDGLIDWKRPAREIFNLIRGMQPWPVAYTYIERKMLKVFGATAHPHPHPPPSRGRELHNTVPSPLAGEGQGEGEKAPGTVVSADKNLAVATGSGTLYLTDVQLEGKKRMTAEAFLRGHPLPVGTRFTSPL